MEQSRILNLPVYVHYLHGNVTFKTNILTHENFEAFVTCLHVM